MHYYPDYSISSLTLSKLYSFFVGNLFINSASNIFVCLKIVDIIFHYDYSILESHDQAISSRDPDDGDWAFEWRYHWNTIVITFFRLIIKNKRKRENKTYAVSAQNSLASLLPISQSEGKTAPIPVRSKSVNLRTNHLYLQNDPSLTSLPLYRTSLRFYQSMLLLHSLHRVEHIQIVVDPRTIDRNQPAFIMK